MYAVMNEDEACLLSAIKAGAPLNSHIDLEDTSVAGKSSELYLVTCTSNKAAISNNYSLFNVTIHSQVTWILRPLCIG